MTPILWVVAATSQIYTLLHNTHYPPKACAVAEGTDPTTLRQGGGKFS